MLGTNKTAGTSRYDGASYLPAILSFKMRYQPNKSKAEKSYRLRQDHIEYRMYSDTQDIRTGDKLSVQYTGPELEFTIIGIDPYDDVMGKHIEVTMRKRNSDMHQDIQIKRPKNTQSNYDPILKEYADVNSLPETDKINMKALVDEAGSHKERWIQVVGAGKYESISYVITTEIDEVINKDDFVQLPDTELYLVDWIYKLPYQTFYGMKKTFKNTSYNL